VVEVLEFLLNAGRRQRTVLKTLFDIEGKKVSIINIHLSPYATNGLREKQMHETFQHLNLGDEAIVVLGDFNYPYHRSKFEEIFKQYNLIEATTKIFATFRSSFFFFPFTFKLDYVLFRSINHISTERIEEQYSDHKPVLSRFSI
jgi:endonuclease/exonuclease/phosphatase family metal-dependent hydrolase